MELPPTGYGGIEAVCADLLGALLRSGHRVTLVGAGRNGTGATFIRTYDRPQGERLGQAVPEVVHAAALPSILSNLDVDVVHDHTFAGPLLAAAHGLPTVVTAHGPTDGEIGGYYRNISRWVHLVAISDAQRTCAPGIPWRATVHNALDPAAYAMSTHKEEYALFLGRMCPEKGIPTAIRAARAAGVPLVIAAKCREAAERRYFDEVVAPLLGEDTRWVGEVGGAAKVDLLGRARCLLFPIDWEEPFGMVMIEAMACGTPVVATARGSVPRSCGTARPDTCAPTRARSPRPCGQHGRSTPRAAARRWRPGSAPSRWPQATCRSTGRWCRRPSRWPRAGRPSWPSTAIVERTPWRCPTPVRTGGRRDRDPANAITSASPAASIGPSTDPDSARNASSAPSAASYSTVS
jgi:hypothetical protein